MFFYIILFVTIGAAIIKGAVYFSAARHSEEPWRASCGNFLFSELFIGDFFHQPSGSTKIFVKKTQRKFNIWPNLTCVNDSCVVL